MDCVDAMMQKTQWKQNSVPYSHKFRKKKLAPNRLNDRLNIIMKWFQIFQNLIRQHLKELLGKKPSWHLLRPHILLYYYTCDERSYILHNMINTWNSILQLLFPHRPIIRYPLAGLGCRSCCSAIVVFKKRRSAEF